MEVDYLSALINGLLGNASGGAMAGNELQSINNLAKAQTGSSMTMEESERLMRQMSGLNGFEAGDPRNFAPNQGSVDGGMMDVVNQMNQMPEEGYLKGMPLPNNVIDGAFHTPEQLIEQKMRNSGNTPMPQGFDIDKVREMIRSQKMR